MHMNLLSWTELSQKICSFARSVAVTLLIVCSSGLAVPKNYSLTRKETKMDMRMIREL